MKGRDFIRSQGKCHSSALRRIEVGIRVRLGSGWLWARKSQQHLTKRGEPTGLAIPARIQHIRKCTRHFLKTAFIKTGVKGPGPMARLVRQVLTIEDHFGFQSTR